MNVLFEKFILLSSWIFIWFYSSFFFWFSDVQVHNHSDRKLSRWPPVFMNFREKKKKKYLTCENRFCPTLDIFSQNSFCGIVNEMFTRRPMWRRSHKQPLQAKEIALWFCCITGFYLKKLLDITRVTVKLISITRVLKRHWHPKGLFWFVFFLNGGWGGWGEKNRNSFCSQVKREDSKPAWSQKYFIWMKFAKFSKQFAVTVLTKNFNARTKWMTATLLLDWNRFDFENNTKLAGKQWMKRLWFFCFFFPTTITSSECSSHFVALKP